MGKRNLLKSTAKKKKPTKSSAEKAVSQIPSSEQSNNPSKKEPKPPKAVDTQSAQNPSGQKKSSSSTPSKKSEPLNASVKMEKNESEKRFEMNTKISEPNTGRLDPPVFKDNGPKVVVTYQGTQGMTMDNSNKRTIGFLTAIVAIIYLLIIGESALNMDRYYIKPVDKGIEVYQGCFSPVGQKLLIALPDVQPPPIIKKVYQQYEVFPFIYQHFIDQADKALDAPGVPDFQKIKQSLEEASKYTATAEMDANVQKRLNGIDLLIYLYKAEVALLKGEPSDLKAGMGYIEQALPLSSSPEQTENLIAKSKAIEMLLKQSDSLETSAPDSTPPSAAAPVESISTTSSEADVKPIETTAPTAAEAVVKPGAATEPPDPDEVNETNPSGENSQTPPDSVLPESDKKADTANQ